MSMLDPTISFYVLHEKTWKFGGGEIYDQHENKVGIMKRKLISMRAEIQLFEPDETLLCTINRKLVSARPIYDVKNPEGELIGRAKRPLVAFRGSIDFYDHNDVHMYKAQGGVTKWNFEITHPQDKKKIYAVIKKADRWRDVFAPAFNFKDRYVIRVEDLDADRLTLLAYAIIIDNVYHDR
ncbi:MAG: LURP-one-related family protein [Promethearchaeota archaeon]